MSRPTSQIKDLKASLSLRPLRISGGNPSSIAFIISRLISSFVEDGNQTLLLVCRDDETAQRLQQDLLVFSEGLVAMRLPAWEQSAFGSISPSIRIRFERVATLARLAIHHQTKSPRLLTLITSLPALAQATLPPEILKNHLFPLQLEAEIPTGSREGFSLLLGEMGYQRVDTVEDPGTFAFRGEIIDLFIPGQEMPLRLELFDTLIERIRVFDPNTQTSPSTKPLLKELWLWPAREVIFSSSTKSILRENLKFFSDENSIPRATRDPAMAAVGAGSFPEASDFWAPFAYTQAPFTGSATGLSHFFNPLTKDANTAVLWVDELSSTQDWDTFSEKEKTRSTLSKERGLIVPAFESLYPWTRAAEETLKENTAIYFDRVELLEDFDSAESAQTEEGDLLSDQAQAQENPPTSKHRLHVLPNSDLRSLTRSKTDPLGTLIDRFSLWKKRGFKIQIFAHTQSQCERIDFLLKEKELGSSVEIREGNLTEGFRWPAEKLVVLDEGDFFGKKRSSLNKGQGGATTDAKDWAGLQSLTDLSTGDLVVHREHGVGRYLGLVRLSLSGAPADFLQLEYANKDKLYLPVYRLNVVQKHGLGGDSSNASLDRLGTQTFAKAKEKVKDAVRKLAVDLLQLYAERAVRKGIKFGPRDSLFGEFEAKFPYEETPDQAKAINATLADLESGRVMDRLVCGDVGYGKTEVAIRAAFKAVTEGRQVVVLVPTTLLAFQHEQSFRTRLQDYAVRIESLSRFKDAKEQRKVLADLAAGKIDIVIGTHRLLSTDVAFSNLGLIIVDEEHRFGVEHKEKLKTIRLNTHVLTLTATPIPRTLHMALGGLRDISLINTPPVDRLPIRTYVSKFDEDLLKRAVEAELQRGGQVFVLHNRVQTLPEFANKIQTLVPQSKVLIGHGQMKENELEKVMLSFYNKEANVLVCTTIIESGIDIPSANTIIIDRADSLGLAQLYQIRGRVGRGQHRAYAYLLIPSESGVSEDAKKRLEVIQKFVELGSGFMVASHDLEIRGGGDLLGAQQSGHIAAVGFDLYTELLEEAIQELRSHGDGEDTDTQESFREPEIKTPFAAYFSEEYLPDIHQRLAFYRRLSSSRTSEGVRAMEEELKDRFGPLPIEAQNMLWIIQTKLLLKSLDLVGLTVGPEKWTLQPSPGKSKHHRFDPAKVVSLVVSQPKKFQLLPDSRLVINQKISSMQELSLELERLVQLLSSS